MDRNDLESQTGQLFSTLWGPYDEKLFEDSVELFHRRLDILGFDREWFKGKTVLDAGCGGGRNTIAMARLGAVKACGIDIGVGGIEDAKRRAESLGNTEFQVSSILEIPYPDNSFDLVWCAGVLMITDDENKALNELTRVLKPGGKLYLLVYATEGMRWPLIELLRPIAAAVGLEACEAAIDRAAIASNKRRTFLDDLFCPKLDFYHWDRLKRMLEERGYDAIDRLGPDVRLDHEHSLKDYREDLAVLLELFEAGADAERNEETPLFSKGADMVRAAVETVALFERRVSAGEISESDAMELVIGQGHHRVFAVKR